MANSEPYTAIRGSERAAVVGAEEAGLADPNEEVRVTVLVRRRPESELAARVEEMSSKSPAQRRYLTREELAAQHGAADADLSRVASWATQMGLRVLGTSALTREVVLTGRVDDLASAFHVDLVRYRYETKTYRGRTGPVHVPTELADIIVGVVGLDDRPQARPRVVVATDQSNVVTPHASGAFTPVQVAQLYQFPTTVTGAGECIGIIELGGGYKDADLSTFFAGLGLSKPTVTAISVDHATNSPSDPAADADFEVALDIEVAGAVAPGANIAVYFAPNSDQGFLDAIAAAIHDTTNNPGVVSISWGASESDWTGQTLDAMEQRFQDAAALGVTVFCASGDDGSTDRATDGLAHVDFPASAPHAVGCGGTRLMATGTAISSEVAWGGSGGGVSDHFDLPTWQNNAGVPASVNPSKRVGRGVPDVGGDADPSSGYKIVVGGSTLVVGGTSAVSPLWAGLLALLNQSLGHHLGFINPTIYRDPVNARGFRDITSGSNGGYAAAAGWDPCTGLGSPFGQQLLNAVKPPALDLPWLGLLLRDAAPVPAISLLTS